MRVSEEQRRTLFELLRDRLDEETARLVLEVTVPANIELATRGDTHELRAEMLLRFAQLDGRIGGLEGRLGGLEAKLTERLYKVVVPVLIASNVLIVAVATWIGTVVG